MVPGGLAVELSTNMNLKMTFSQRQIQPLVEGDGD